MKRYVAAHWRGELSLVESFLVNGVLAFSDLDWRCPASLWP